MSPNRFDASFNNSCTITYKVILYFSISAPERLIVTLQYLATVESQQTQSFYFRISRSTVCKIVVETFHAIWDELKSTYLKAPEHVSEWQKLAKGFNQE